MKLSKLMAMSVLAASVASAAIVSNGGFELGNFSSWTLAGGCANVKVGGAPFICGSLDSDVGPHTGTYAAYLGSTGNPGNRLSQTLATSAGATYAVDFWLAVPTLSGLATPNFFTVLAGGNTVNSATNLPAAGYTHYTFNFVAAGASTVLQFNTSNNPAYFILDDVSVNFVSGPSVPEPASVALLGVGGAVLIALKRLRRR